MNEIDSKLVFDVDENAFVEKVIEISDKKLIIVDFWAPWCGPCKQLTPILEKITNKSKGAFLLAKVNIDNNQQIASQLNIQSIPAVFAFKNKQAIDAFQGVIPEAKIIEFIEKHLEEKIEKDFSEFYEQINKLLLEKNYDEVKDLIEKHLVDNSDDKIAISQYIECLTSLGLFDQVSAFTESLDQNMLKDEKIKSAIQKFEIRRKNTDGPTIKELKEKLNKKPNDINNIMALSEKLFAENLLDEAFDLLFQNFSNEKERKKKKILDFFEALGNNNEKTILYRKKLSSILFS